MEKNVTLTFFLRLSFLFILSISSVYAKPTTNKNNINIQLRWSHQFQFAGYYAALEKGYYKEEGLNVKLIDGDPTHQPVEEVLSGRAQYAEGNSEVLYQRLKGKPLVALAAIFQHSPSVLIALQSSGINSVHSLVGKKVMLATKQEDSDFLTMIINEGISLDQVNIIRSSYQLEDLINGNVDAFNSYSTNEPFILDKLGLKYNIINPTSYSIDFYSDILFTSENEISNNPKRVAAVLRATLKGWRYAMDNQEEIIDLLITKYKVTKTREHLRFEANEMRKLILPDLIQIGHMNQDRLNHMANSFITAKLIPNKKYFNGFIYDPSKRYLPDWIILTLFFALLLIIITSFIIYHLHKLNRRIIHSQATLLESEERFRAITEATYGGIIIHKDGIILECNNALSDITGYSYNELVGDNALKLISPEYVDLTIINMRTKQHESYEIIGLHKNGYPLSLSVKGKDITFKGQPARVVEFIDISERKKMDEQLKLAASVFTHAREGIMITNTLGEIIEINDTFTHITGYDRDYVIGKSPSLLKSGLHEDHFYSEIWQSLKNNHQWSGELWNLRKNGELFASLLTISAVSDHNGNIKTYVALFSDITEMKQHQQQLEHIAHYDVLTNLPNRILLAKRLKHAMKATKKNNLSLAVVYLDLDGFKIINDTYGHDVGDELLIELSRLMTACLREGDTLARIGGDEFIAVLTNIEVMDDCEQVIKRLLKTAMTPIIVESNKTAQVSTSIGVTLYPYDYVEADQLMRHADQAMYRAKQTGKNRYHLFDVHQDKSIQSQHESIANINRGIENTEFLIHYQPKVNMISGVVIGVEALIRWQHPTRGLIYPKDFLHVINNRPISIKLGEWIIETVLDQIETWHVQGSKIPVSINIDAFQLEQPGFVEKLSAALNKRPLIKPGLLQLEILETSALGDISKVLPIMKACIDIGVTFALDDFGTGFSSLTYLRRLSAELLKIDQSFVRDMLDDPDDRAIVMGVISLASAFNHKVIAEGVESIDHGTQLIAMGCELAQGFGIAKPMLPEKIPAWIKQWKPDPSWVQ